MIRKLIGALTLVACSGESLEATRTEASECGWSVSALTSLDATCWRMSSVDVGAVRLRIDGQKHDCWGVVGGCDLFACETVSAGPGDVVQTWTAPDFAGDSAALTTISACD